MPKRFSLLYEYSTDYGTTWTDITDAVDSLQTKVLQSLCSNNFMSSKDSLTFTLPATSLPVKNQLINDLLGPNDILVRTYIPSPVAVSWDSSDPNVDWDADPVYWRGLAIQGRSIGFTGYIDRKTLNLRSYPLPAALTLTAYDVSSLHLDDKVNKHLLLENKKISEIVHALLLDAGYSYDASTLDPIDDVVLEAFVIDKDNSKTYRQYIDTLLFEAGGYVLDFMPSGVARIFHLPWNDPNGPSRTIDNPMNDGGIQIKSAWLKEDGVKLKWATLEWRDQARIWKDSINRSWGAISDDEQDVVGEWIKMNRCWPVDGDLTPSYMEYRTDWLDDPYLHKDTRKQNEDLSVVMARNVGAVIEATRGGKKYEFPIPAGYPIPTSPTDYTDDPYNFTSNPMLWPKKAWYLLYNPQWSPVTPNGTENPRGEGWWYLNGTVYTKATETTVTPGRQYYIGATYTAVTPQGTENPAYEGWCVLSGGNYVLTTDVTVQPGTTYYKAPDGEVNLQSFEIYGDVLYRSKINTLETDGTTDPKEYSSEYIYDAAQAQRFLDFYWHFLQTSRYSMTWSEPYLNQDVGDVVEITQKGMVYSQDAVIVAKTIQFINDRTPVIQYSGVGVEVPVLSDGVAYSTVPQGGASNTSYTQIEIEQKVEEIAADIVEWDFEMSQDSVTTDMRLSYGSTEPYTFTKIALTAKKTGNESILPMWTCTGAESFFEGSGVQTTSGDTANLIIPKNETASLVKVTMTDYNNPGTPTITKGIATVDQTEYNHDFGAWTPQDDGTNAYVLPDHITKGTQKYDVLNGDFFISKGFSTQGTQVLAPTGNPHENGYYEQGGAGTLHRPYFYFLSEDTSVVGGKDYYTPAGTDYPEGVPFILENDISWNEMTISQDNSDRLLSCLGNVMNSGIAVPSATALWGWFQNLVAQNALITNLFSQQITILSGGHIKGGDRYDASGNLADWSKKGFWFGADGTLKALIQSDLDQNTYIGTEVGSDTDVDPGNSTKNTAIGYQAMYANWHGKNNVVMGYQAMYNLYGGNVAGSNNTAIGYQALYNNDGTGASTSQGNTALGYKALYSNVAGSFNVGIGAEADCININGSYQMNINNSIYYAEFKSGRNIADVASKLVSLHPGGAATYVVPAMGMYEGSPIYKMEIKSSSVKIFYSGSTYTETITTTTAGTTSEKAVFFFVDMINTLSRSDCIS